LGALGLLGGIVAYSAIAVDRFFAAVLAAGCVGLALTALALVGRWAELLPLGLVGVATAYAGFLAIRSDGIDSRAPFVAATFFVAAELAYWSIERRSWRSEGRVVGRRLALIVSAGFATAIVGGLLLLIVSGRRAGIGVEALGTAAAVLTLAVVAVLVRRSRAAAS
jgi:hypothetical protein